MRSVDVNEEEKRILPYIRELTNRWNNGVCIADIQTLYPESMTRSLLPFLKEKGYPVFEFDLSVPQSFSFFPFLAMLSGKENNSSINRLIDTSPEIYELHRPVLRSILKGEKAVRDEIIIQEEIQYESERFQEELLYLLQMMTAESPTVLICTSLPYLQYSSIRLLNRIIEDKKSLNLLILFLSEEGYLLSSRKRIKRISNFRQLIKEKGYTFRRIKESVSESPAPALRWQKEVDMTEKLLHNALEVLALEDVEEILDLFPSSFDRDRTFEIDFLKAHLSYLQENWDMALLQFTELKEKGREDRTIYSRTLLFLAAAYIRKSCFTEARQICEELDDYPVMKENRRGVLYLSYIRLMIEKQEHARDVEIWDRNLKKLEDMGMSLGYKNTVAYWLTAPYELNYLYRKDIIFHCQNRAMELAEELGNEFRLGALYHTKSLYYLWQRSEEGFIQALELLKQSESIRIKLNQKRELVNLYNGRGFLFYQYGDYHSAFLEYEKAIELIDGLNDDLEYSLSLFNIARTYFSTGMFSEAGSIVDGILMQLEILGESTIPLQSPLEILSIQILANDYSRNSFQGEELKAKLQIEWGKEQNKRDVDIFLYNWAMGVFTCFSHDEETSRNHIEKCLNMAKKAESNSMIPSYFPALIYQCLLLPLFNEKEKEDLKKEGKSILTENQKEYFPAFFGKIKKKTVLPLISIDIDQILKQTRKNREINSLHKRIKNIDFLNSFFTLVSESEKREDLFRKSFAILENHFQVKDPVFIRKEKGEWKRVGGEQDWYIDAMEKRKLGEILTIRKNTVILPDSIKSNSFIVGMPGLKDKDVDTAFLAKIPGEHYRSFSELVPIFEMALKSLFQANRRIKARDDLSRLAHTDSLTGLFNRKAFWSEVDMELERYRRHENSTVPCLTIIYLDLDNFKYYNDTFGHQSGDQVLQKFAEMMKSHFRLTDIISRFGGDEFVIMLPETSERQTEKIIIRFLKDFRTEFLEELHRKLYLKSVPKTKRLSCSIGIGEYKFDEDLPFDDFMARVDALMYEVKKAGKNGYRCLGY